eukprot:scpid106513/ scgid20890/ 
MERMQLLATLNILSSATLCTCTYYTTSCTLPPLLPYYHVLQYTLHHVHYHPCCHTTMYYSTHYIMYITTLAAILPCTTVHTTSCTLPPLALAAILLVTMVNAVTVLSKKNKKQKKTKKNKKKQ